ncbi:MAG: sensor domain-containing diguanylate cyclase [Sporomusaceae bacterium]|nr:sensor domain-containing diguanylate cyclase [Sporomusaceae bacterium]
MRFGFRESSLQRRINAFILIISFFLLALSVVIALIASNHYEKAKSLEETSRVSRALVKAVGDLAMERGRLNVVLRSEEPISEANRIFIAERRQLADGQLQAVLLQLKRLYPDQAALLAQSYAALGALRVRADSEASRPYPLREPGFAQLWLQQTTGFIYNLENILLYLGRYQSDEGSFFLYYQLMLDSVRFRHVAGYHASVLTSLLVRPENDRQQQEEKRAFFKLQADSVWDGIVMQADYLAKPAITGATDRVEFFYYQLYRPQQENLMELAAAGRLQAGEIARLQRLSVDAFDAIARLGEAADASMRQYVEAMTVRARILLLAGAAQFAVCALLVAGGIAYFQRRLFRPLRRIIRALEQLGGNAEIDLSPEELQRSDEIGRINRGVQRLQQSIVQERLLMTENEQLAMTDFLTGCLNKRGFYLLAGAELERAAREQTPTSFLFADLDDLKLVNDQYGHLVGDEAVKYFAACVKGQCRPYDLVGRFGGDEFVFCFPRADGEQALQIVRRIETALDQSGFSVMGTGVTLQLSASFGLITRLPEEDRDIEWLIRQADIALYQAKQKGKHCVILNQGEADGYC